VILILRYIIDPLGGNSPRFIIACIKYLYLSFDRRNFALYTLAKSPISCHAIDEHWKTTAIMTILRMEKYPGIVLCAVDPFRVCDILLMTLKRDVTSVTFVSHPHRASQFNCSIGRKFGLFKNIQSRFNDVFTMIFTKQELLIEVLIHHSFSVFIT